MISSLVVKQATAGEGLRSVNFFQAVSVNSLILFSLAF